MFASDKCMRCVMTAIPVKFIHQIHSQAIIHKKDGQTQMPHYELTYTAWPTVADTLYMLYTFRCLKSSRNSNLIPFHVFDIQNGATMNEK